MGFGTRFLLFDNHIFIYIDFKKYRVNIQL